MIVLDFLNTPWVPMIATGEGSVLPKSNFPQRCLAFSSPILFGLFSDFQTHVTRPLSSLDLKILIADLISSRSLLNNQICCAHFNKEVKAARCLVVVD